VSMGLVPDPPLDADTVLVNLAPWSNAARLADRVLLGTWGGVRVADEGVAACG
jgi:hypothetical protein